MAIIKREIGYFQGKPALFLAPVVRDNGKRFIIKLNDVWKYSEDHNDRYESFLANRVLQLCMLFDIQIPKGKKLFVQAMSGIATVIMEGIDDLIKLKPRDEEQAGIADRYDVAAPKVINTEGMTIH